VKANHFALDEIGIYGFGGGREKLFACLDAAFEPTQRRQGRLDLAGGVAKARGLFRPQFVAKNVEASRGGKGAGQMTWRSNEQVDETSILIICPLPLEIGRR
jgi:hypothetical protein